jgi:hypothetical protein
VRITRVLQGTDPLVERVGCINSVWLVEPADLQPKPSSCTPPAFVGRSRLRASQIIIGRVLISPEISVTVVPHG